MQANFPSNCLACEDRIHEGDLIRRSSLHSAYIHEGCYDPDAEQDEEEERELPTRKRPGGLAARVRTSLETGVPLADVKPVDARAHSALAEKSAMLNRPHVFLLWRTESNPDGADSKMLMSIHSTEKGAVEALLQCKSGGMGGPYFTVVLHGVSQ